MGKHSLYKDLGDLTRFIKIWVIQLAQFLKFPRVGMSRVHYFEYKNSFFILIPKMFYENVLMSIRISWDIFTERLGISQKKLFQ